MAWRIDGNVVLFAAPQGPLVAFIAEYVRWQRGQGYAPCSLQQRARVVAGFSRWLGERGIGLRRVSAEHASKYLRYRSRQMRPCGCDARVLTQLIDFLRHREAIPAEKIRRAQLTPVERCVQGFERYLREERGLVNGTIANYSVLIRAFLVDRFRGGSVTLSDLNAGDVVRFVQCRGPTLRQNRAKVLTSALRGFLGYARYRGYFRLDLAAAVPQVANWSMTAIPRGIAPDQVRRLLGQIDRDRAIGIRDYAIFLLLARLGLRAGEVAFLELDDINWKEGYLTVRGKGGRRVQLPLPADVGEAIVAYLRNGRPRSPCRRLFLRACAPVRGFLGPAAVCSMVRHAIQRSGISAPSTGAHQFRHGLATEMLRGGATLAEIGEVLGHSNPQTTKIYTKVDLDALRSLALPWPGGAR
jgi:integrase/recombinase XerD